MGRFWYKAIEGTLQVLFVGSLGYAFAVFVVLAKTPPPVDQEIRIGVFVVLFLLASFVFRKLASGEENKQKRSVFTAAYLSAGAFIVTTAVKLDLTGFHLVVLLIVIAIGIASAFAKNDSLSTLFKFLLGLMSGLQTERRFSKRLAHLNPDEQKAPI